MNMHSTETCSTCSQTLPSGVSTCSQCASNKGMNKGDSHGHQKNVVSGEKNAASHASESVEALALDVSDVVCLDEDAVEGVDSQVPVAPDSDNSQDISLECIALDVDDDDDDVGMCDVPPPAPSLEEPSPAPSSPIDTQDLSLDMIAVEDDTCDVPPPAPSDSIDDAQEIALDVFNIIPEENEVCDVPPPAPTLDVPPPAPTLDVPPPAPTLDVPPPAPSLDVPPPAPSLDVPPPAPTLDVPPPAPTLDVPPPAPTLDVGAEVRSENLAIFDFDKIEMAVPSVPLDGLKEETNKDQTATKSSVSFTIQAENIAEEVVQTFEVNQPTPNTEGQLFLNSDINIIPDGLEDSDKTTISAEFALADTGVAAVPVDDHEAGTAENIDIDIDKTAAYDRPAFLDTMFPGCDEKATPVDGTEETEDKPALSDPQVGEKNTDKEELGTQEDCDQTVIAPTRQTQQDTSAGLKAIPSRDLSQLGFGTSLALSSKLQAKKQDSPALLESSEQTSQPEKITNHDLKPSKRIAKKTDDAKTAENDADNPKTPSDPKSADMPQVASRSSEARRKVSEVVQNHEQLQTIADDEHESGMISIRITLGQLGVISLMLVVIILLILLIFLEPAFVTDFFVRPQIEL